MQLTNARDSKNIRRGNIMQEYDAAGTTGLWQLGVHNKVAVRSFDIGFSILASAGIRGRAVDIAFFSCNSFISLKL